MGNPIKIKLTAALAAFGLAGALLVPATAGADASAISSGMTLVFAAGKAHSVADNVAVPVECLGEGHGFCSGVVTLSRRSHRVSIPFSVRGGSHEVLFVPLRLNGGKAHPRKFHGVATTVQPEGPPTSTKEFLFAE
ncbi:MAG: hypothetical protein JST08_00920 [Actinobacteria bacterium]|nr:hypothetical protein [Actinomycetota bacterium]